MSFTVLRQRDVFLPRALKMLETYSGKTIWDRRSCRRNTPLRPRDLRTRIRHHHHTAPIRPPRHAAETGETFPQTTWKRFQQSGLIIPIEMHNLYLTDLPKGSLTKAPTAWELHNYAHIHSAWQTFCLADLPRKYIDFVAIRSDSNNWNDDVCICRRFYEDSVKSLLRFG